MADLNSLPIDILLLIIENITRQSQLRKLCQVSRHIQDVALRVLYRSVTIILSAHPHLRERTPLHRQSPGLRYIRELTIYRVPDDQWRESIGISFLMLTVTTIPENGLRSLRLGEGVQICAGFLKTLAARQKMLTHLSCTDMDFFPFGDASHHVIAAIDSGFSDVTSLSLKVDDNTGLFAASKLMANLAQQLSTLHIEHGDRWSQPHLADEYMDSIRGPGALNQSLFEPMIRFDVCRPLARLTSLSLVNVNLKHAEMTWCRVVDFTRCNKLRLKECPGMEALFELMCQDKHRPTMLTALDITDQYDEHGDAVSSINQLLKSVSGVVDLRLELWTHEQTISPDAIVRHASSLKVLLVHITTTEADRILDILPWTSKDFERICTACASLNELSCPWPQGSIAGKSPEWEQYIETIVQNMPMLVTLHITDFPDNSFGGSSLDGSEYSCLLQNAARGLFMSTQAHRPYSARRKPAASGLRRGRQAVEKLKFVAFGINNDYGIGYESMTLRAYTPSTAIDEYGYKVLYATPMRWRMHRHIDPRSTVLDHDFRHESVHPVVQK